LLHSYTPIRSQSLFKRVRDQGWGQSVRNVFELLPFGR
jgi:hypothetical protein